MLVVLKNPGSKLTQTEIIPSAGDMEPEATPVSQVNRFWDSV